jgi:hypothetical protein
VKPKLCTGVIDGAIALAMAVSIAGDVVEPGQSGNPTTVGAPACVKGFAQHAGIRERALGAGRRRR